MSKRKVGAIHPNRPPKSRRGAGDRKSIASTIPKIRDEAELYRALGLDFIPPELRENCGEFEAAENRENCRA